MELSSLSFDKKKGKSKTEKKHPPPKKKLSLSPNIKSSPAPPRKARAQSR